MREKSVDRMSREIMIREIENMIANTCFAYNELIEFIGTDNQLTGIVAVGAANEAPPKRPRKALRDVVEYR